MGVTVISTPPPPFWAQKLFIHTFLDMMYVGIIKNFFLADSSELMGVRVISASSAQKHLIPTF